VKTKEELFQILDKYFADKQSNKQMIDYSVKAVSSLFVINYAILPDIPEKLKKILSQRNVDPYAIYHKLIEYCDERSITPSELCRMANVSRNTWSKIGRFEEVKEGDYSPNKRGRYIPSKNTLIQFALALKLPLKETQELLILGGYALNPEDDFDVIIILCIENDYYDLYTVNEALKHEKQKQLFKED